MHSIGELIEDLQESGKWPNKLSEENIREIISLAGYPKRYIFGEGGKLDVNCIYEKKYKAVGSRTGYKGRRYGACYGAVERTFTKVCWLIEASENKNESSSLYVVVSTYDDNDTYGDFYISQISFMSLIWKLYCHKNEAARGFKPLLIDSLLISEPPKSDHLVLDCIADVKKAYDNCLEKLIDSVVRYKTKVNGMSNIERVVEI